MSKINKNLRKIDIYTLPLLLCSMFSCNNGDNNYSAINNEKLLGVPEENPGEKNPGGNPGEKNPVNNIINNNVENNNNINSHSEDKNNGTYMTIFVNQGDYKFFINQLMKNIKYQNKKYDTKHNIEIKKNKIFIYINEDSLASLDNDVNNIQNNINKGDKDFTMQIKIDPEITTLVYLFKDCVQMTKAIIKCGSNVTDMSFMFWDCTNLKEIESISNWNTNNVTDMQGMFYKCISLEKIPDISKWNTNNVTSKRGMFYNCSSLQFLPDISKWNINKGTNMSHMFHGCSSLGKIPDISKIFSVIIRL